MERRPSVGPIEYLAWLVARTTRSTSARTAGEYVESARLAGHRRRSPWNLLLVPAALIAWAVLWYAMVRALAGVYAATHAVTPPMLLPERAPGILMAVGALFAALPPSLVVANYCAALVPAARRVFEAEARPFPDLTFASANRGLLRMAFVLTPAGLAVGLIGSLLP
jgi:hypothetical protein